MMMTKLTMKGFGHFHSQGGAIVNLAPSGTVTTAISGTKLGFGGNRQVLMDLLLLFEYHKKRLVLSVAYWGIGQCPFGKKNLSP